MRGRIPLQQRRLLKAALLFWIAATSAAAAAPPVPQRIAADVYAFVGGFEELSQANRGEVGNGGFIVAADGVIQIDTGASHRQGEARLAAIRRVSRYPVRLGIVTHAVQEFVFGNTALAAQRIPLLAHVRTAELMRERCGNCLDNMRKVLGKAALAGSRVEVPSLLVEGSASLRVSGRKLELLHFGWASTPGDLAVFDPHSGTLFAGGLAVAGRVPNLRDADVDGWIGALEQLLKLPLRHVVPAYGPPGGSEVLRDTRDYLLAVRELARAYYERGDGLLDAMTRAELPAYAERAMYKTLHPQNVQRLYLKFEEREFQQEVPAPDR